MKRPALLWLLLVAAIPLISTASALDAPTLLLSLGYGGTVTSLDVSPRPTPLAGKPLGGLQCAAKGGYVLVPPTPDANGHPFCVTASAQQGLSVAFLADVPFVTPKQLNCTALHGPAADPAANLISIVARIGRVQPTGKVLYDGGRAECDIGPAFAYALSVETQTAASIVQPGMSTRTIVIPWTQLHLDRSAARIMIHVNVCDADPHCVASPVYAFIPLGRIGEGAGSLTLSNVPLVRTNTPVPKAGATPPRAHQVEGDAAYSWDHRDLLSTAFAQDQSTVAAQRALSQALSLTQVPLPASAGQPQSLQTQSQPLFAFEMPSEMLEDPAMKGLFDLVPFSVTRVNSLASGFAYGYSSQTLKVGSFYGLQARGISSGGISVTIALATPRPSPEPTPTPTPSLHTTSAEVSLKPQPLKPPPPPAPFF